MLCLSSSSKILCIPDSEAILAHDATKKTHQWSLIKCMINFWATPVPQWPLLWVINNCGSAVVFTGLTTGITSFLSGPPCVDLRGYVSESPELLLKLPSPGHTRRKCRGVWDQAVFIFVWFWSQFLIVKIVCFVLLSFLYPCQRDLYSLPEQWFLPHGARLSGGTEDT